MSGPENENEGFMREVLPPNIPPEETPLYQLWKRCQETAGAYRGESQGLRVKVEMPGYGTIETEITPQPAARSYPRRRQEPKPVSKDQMLEALKGLEDRVTLEEKDDRFIARPKRFLGDQWSEVNDQLRPAGFRWIRDGKNGRWEASKK